MLLKALVTESLNEMLALYRCAELIANEDHRLRSSTEGNERANAC